MTTLATIIEGLTILQRYAPASQDVTCAHDILLAPAVPKERMQPDDLARLEALGWFVSGEYDCWAYFV